MLTDDVLLLANKEGVAADIVVAGSVFVKTIKNAPDIPFAIERAVHDLMM